MALGGPPRSHENGAAAKAIFTPVPRKREFSEVRSYKRAAVCASQAPYRDPHSLARPLLAIDGYIRVENPLRAVASCYGPTSPRISMVGPVSMPRGKEPHRGGEDSLGHDTRGGLQRMNRRGLWAAGVVLILLVVGAGVLTVGAGYAKGENTAKAKCSEATLKGTYLFAGDGVAIKGDDQLPFSYAGYEVFDGNGKVKQVLTLNMNGKKVIHK